MSILKFIHKMPQSPDALCPGQVSAYRVSTEQFSRARKAQHVQNLLLDRIQLGKLRVEQTAISSPDKDNAVVSKGLHDARYGWFEIVSAFRHQAPDWFIPFSQHPANLSFNQSCDQAADHDQEDQADNPLWLLQEHRPDPEELIGQAEAMLYLVLAFPLLQQTGIIQSGRRPTAHPQPAS